MTHETESSVKTQHGRELSGLLRSLLIDMTQLEDIATELRNMPDLQHAFSTDDPVSESDAPQQQRHDLLDEASVVLQRLVPALCGAMQAVRAAPLRMEEQAELWRDLRELQRALPVHLHRTAPARVRHFARLAQGALPIILHAAAARLESWDDLIAPREEAMRPLTEITPAAWRVLKAMAKLRRPMPQEDIAATAEVSRSTVSRSLPALVSAGLAEQRSKRDGAVITARGLLIVSEGPEGLSSTAPLCRTRSNSTAATERSAATGGSQRVPNPRDRIARITRSK